MNFAFLSDWTEILPREGGHLVTLRGGGGKTALMSALADALGAAGVPVAVARDGADGPLDWPGLVRAPIDAPPEPVMKTRKPLRGTSGNFASIVLSISRHFSGCLVSCR